MNKIPYEDRLKTYNNAIERYGRGAQCIVAIEELSECQKEICKLLRGKADLEHLAEEVADATIMLEQIRLMFDINDYVCRFMDEKIQRLNDRLSSEDHGGAEDGK